MKCREEIIAAGTARTPFGRFGGSLREVDIYDLGAYAMKGTLDKTGIDPKQVDEVWWGCGDTTNCKDPYTPVVARQTLIKAGLLLVPHHPLHWIRRASPACRRQITVSEESCWARRMWYWQAERPVSALCRIWPEICGGREKRQVVFNWRIRCFRWDIGLCAGCGGFRPGRGVVRRDEAGARPAGI